MSLFIEIERLATTSHIMGNLQCYSNGVLVFRCETRESKIVSKHRIENPLSSGYYLLSYNKKIDGRLFIGKEELTKRIFGLISNMNNKKNMADIYLKDSDLFNKLPSSLMIKDVDSFRGFLMLNRDKKIHLYIK